MDRITASDVSLELDRDASKGAQGAGGLTLQNVSIKQLYSEEVMFMCRVGTVDVLVVIKVVDAGPSDWRVDEQEEEAQVRVLHFPRKRGDTGFR